MKFVTTDLHLRYIINTHNITDLESQPAHELTTAIAS